MLVEINANSEIAVIGDIHEQTAQWEEMLVKIQPSSNRPIVLLGDIYDKGDGRHIAEAITDQAIELQKQGCLYAVRGNHEAKHIQKERKNLSPQLLWWKQQPLSITFRFPNGSMVTCLHAGITPHHTTFDSIGSHSEVLYVRNIDQEGRMIRLKWVEEGGEKKLVEEKPNGISWHQLYDGRFGYIASGHQQQLDGEPKFYNYSCNLDTACYITGILTCQIFDQSGRRGLIQVKGNR